MKSNTPTPYVPNSFVPPQMAKLINYITKYIGTIEEYYDYGGNVYRVITNDGATVLVKCAAYGSANIGDNIIVGLANSLFQLSLDAHTVLVTNIQITDELRSLLTLDGRVDIELHGRVEMLKNELMSDYSKILENQYE